MLYYSFADIMRSHNVSKSALRKMIDSGKLKAQKLIVSRDNPNCFKYIIPETELPKLAKFKFCEPVASVDAQPDYYEKCWREYDERQKVSEEKVRKMFEECEKYYTGFVKKHRDYIPYYDYLHSEEWREKRRQALKRDGYRCQMCGSGTNLCVHHITYENLHTDAEMDDLVTLCDKCHEEVHAVDLERKEWPTIYMFGEEI